MRFARLISIASLLGPCLRAAPDRFHVYSEPNIAVLAITQGPDGWLWLAAEDGLYRFDGASFVKMQEFPCRSARALAMTGNGAVWIGSREGLVRFDGRFKQFLDGNVRSMVAFRDRLALRMGDNDLISVGLDGKVNARVVSGGAPFVSPAMNGFWLVKNAALELDANSLREVSEHAIPAGCEQAAEDRQGRMWVARNQNAARVDRQGVEIEVVPRVFSQQTDRAPPLFPGRNGNLWFAGETIRELGSGREFHGAQMHDQYLPTAVFEDSRGHVWVAKRGLGLLEWIPDTGWERWYSEDFNNQRGLSIVRGAGSTFAATHGGIYRLGTDTVKGRMWEPVTTQLGDLDSLLPISSGGFWAAIRGLGLCRLSEDGKVSKSIQFPGVPIRNYRELIRDSTGRLWVATKQELLWLDEAKQQLHSVPLPERSPGGPAGLDLELDQTGRVWTDYEGGLAFQDGAGTWHRLRTSEPVRSIRSFSLAESTGNDIWVAYRDGGRFSRLQRRGETWQVTHFDAEAGYGPQDTHFIKRDSRGWIWRGVTDGVLVSNGVKTAPGDWIHIGLSDGLASDAVDMYGFFEDDDHSVWISGEKGLTHLRPEVSWFASKSSGPLDRFQAPPVQSRRYWPWFALGLGGLAMVGWLLRTHPATETIRFKLARQAFLLRRRFKRTEVVSSAPGMDIVDRSGEVLDGRYELLRPLSRGGFSVVYEGKDRQTERPVAVKVLDIDPARQGWVRERFAHEVAALSSIRHPGVVPILNSWIEADGSPCLAMPLLEGVTLEAALRDAPFPPKRVSALVLQIAAALAEAHSRGVIHRDLKPENIMLVAGDPEQAVLLDFGTAGLRGSPDETSTTTMLAGSFHYMAPERLMGQYGAASDLYSFGVIVLEMLTGRRLSTVGSLPGSAGFRPALVNLLREFLDEPTSREMGGLLDAVYAADPDNRPKDVARWAGTLTRLMSNS
ncbi:MAG: protein kinase [Bryobacteraceae bacterium]